MMNLTLLLMVALVVGFFAGLTLARWSGNNTATVERWVQRGTSFSVLLLLYSLGCDLGRDPDARESLSELGALSVVLAAGAMAGSVLFSRLFDGQREPTP